MDHITYCESKRNRVSGFRSRPTYNLGLCVLFFKKRSCALIIYYQRLCNNMALTFAAHINISISFIVVELL